MTPSLETLTVPNKLPGEDAGPWSTVFERNTMFLGIFSSFFNKDVSC